MIITEKTVGRAIGTIFVVQIVCVLGYLLNIIKVVVGALSVESFASVDTIGIPLIIQAVGVIFPPLGVITGIVIW